MKNRGEIKKISKEKNSNKASKIITTKRKVCGAIILLVLIVIAIIAALLLNRKKENKGIYGDPENLRAMSYEQFGENDDKVYVEGTQGTDSEQIVDSIKFRSFFLRDLDGDGYAERLKGTCKEIGDEDTLYMEIVVQTEGYLKDGKIQVDGKNFYLQTALPKDSEIKNNYMGNNTHEIEFKTLNNGIQKLFSGKVRSGNYTYSSQKTDAIGSNINNYSRDDNKIELTGTYVNGNGEEIQIRKEISLTMDWYGTTSAIIYTKNSELYGTQVYNDVESRVDEDNGTFTLDFSIYPKEIKNKLNLSNNYTEGTIPELNGYEPIDVTLTSDNGEFNYNKSTRKFTIKKDAIVSGSGIITSRILPSIEYGIRVVYPIEAYTTSYDEEVSISIPVKTCFYGFNNPNIEFQNPYVSNIASETIVANYRKSIGHYGSIDMDIKVGKYIEALYKSKPISKKKPLRLYGGLSSEEINDFYIVSWHVSTGLNSAFGKLVLKENINGEILKKDTFVKSDNTEESMDDVTSNVGVYFSNADGLFKEGGEIKIYDDDTDNLLVTFTKNGKNRTKGWNNYNSNNPYYYDVPVKHIRVETTETNALEYITIYNVKELDDEAITNKYEKEEFDNFKYIKSNLCVCADESIVGVKDHKTLYEEPYSKAYIRINKDIISTQVTEKNFEISISATFDEGDNQEGWKNGTYLVKIPDEILFTEINSVSVNNTNVEILSYEIIQKENNKFIKIKTSNEEPIGYIITIDGNITPDPRVATMYESFVLYGMNKEINNYQYESEDIFDVDDDGNIAESVNCSSAYINLVAPNSLLTNQTMSEFDESGTVVISPQIADLKPIYSEDNSEKQTIKIGVQIKNNYSNTISDTKILGKIPFEGNSYVLSRKNLNSEFSTNIKPYEDTQGVLRGIEVPEELKDKISIYYSENENPTKDLMVMENGWVLEDDVENWNNIKTYLIDLEENVIDVGAEYIFYYTAEIPFGVEFNKIAFSHHGVYFSLDTPEGKYRTSTEPNKMGLRIADIYNLELTKYQKGNNNKVGGAVYKVSKLTDEGEIEESSTAFTNDDGKIEIANLYVERRYEITEIETSNNYELNDGVIGIIGHINRTNGTLTIEKLYGDTRGDIIVQKNEGEDYKAKINVEDEVRATLKIIKTDKDTNVPIKGVKFRINGTGIGINGRTLKTNDIGEVTLNGIRLGEEYTLEEIKAEGYYLGDPITFKIINDGGTYILKVKAEDDNYYTVNENGEYIVGIDDGQGNIVNETKTVECLKSSIFTEEDLLPVLNLNIGNQMIPRFNLEITKLNKKTTVESGGNGETTEEIVYLKGAKFKLFKGEKELGTYISDENGKILIEDLYQYEIGRNIDQTYTLKEVCAPEGYTKVKDITFKVYMDSDVLKYEETLEEGQNKKEYSVENNTIKLIVKDNPIFKLIKKDVETLNVLPNTKFSIYNIDDEEMPARNSKGELIGVKEIINGKEYYIVTTDSNGEITADLPEGLYKAVEIEASDPKYDIENQTYYFGIGKSKEGAKGIFVDKYAHISGTGSIDALKTIKLEDDTYVSILDGTKTGIYMNDEFLTGSSSSNSIAIVRHDIDFNILNSTSILGNNYNYNDLIDTNDGGYILVYSYEYNSTNEIYIKKYDYNNRNSWTKTIRSSSYINYYSIDETDEGKIIFVISTYGTLRDVNNDERNTSNCASVMYYLDSSGNTEWVETFKDNKSFVLQKGYYHDNKIYALGYFTRNNYSINGEEYTTRGGDDSVLIKYDEEGNYIKSNIIGGNANEYVLDMIFKDDSYIVFGRVDASTTIDGITINNNWSSGRFIARYNYEDTLLNLKIVDTNQSISESRIINLPNDNYIVCITQNMGNMVEGQYVGVEDYGSAPVLIKYNGEDKATSVIYMGGRGHGKSDNADNIFSVLQVSENEYIVSGNFSGKKFDFNNLTIPNSSTDTKNNDGYIIKCSEVNIESYEEKARYLKLEDDTSSNVRKMINTKDNALIIVGYTYDSNFLSHYIGEYGVQKNFIAKLDSNFNPIWVKRISNMYLTVKQVIQTEENHTILLGNYNNNIEFEDYRVNVDARYNGLVAEYDEYGNLIWVKNYSTSNFQEFTDICVLNNNDILIGGSYKNSINYGNSTVTSYGKKDAVIIKCDRYGNVKDLMSIGGEKDDDILTLCPTKDGNYVVGGSFESNSIKISNTEYIENSNYMETIPNARNNMDGFAIKYDLNNNVIWSKGYGSPMITTGTYDANTTKDRVLFIGELSTGELIVVGDFTSQYIIIDGNQFNNNTSWTSSAGSNENGNYNYRSYHPNCFITKYDSNGTYQDTYLLAHSNKGDSILSTSITDKDEIIIGEYYEVTNYNSSRRLANTIMKMDKNLNQTFSRIYPSVNPSVNGGIENNYGEIIVYANFYYSFTFLNKTIIDYKNSNNHGLVFKLATTSGMTEAESITAYNKRKEYTITTDIRERDGIKGGTISGEDIKPYETIKYGDSNLNEIVITPDDGYEIVEIKVNDEDWQFEPNQNDSYTMPPFENVTENKRIVVTFAKKENKIILNKVDSHTNENIKQSGVEFVLDQLEERETPIITNIFGDLTNNGISYYNIDLNNEITGALGDLTGNGTNYFVAQEDDTGNISYVPNNSKTWQIANVDGATSGVQNTTAHSYIPIDLSGLTGNYKVVVNAECSSQIYCDYGVARVTGNTSPLAYNNSTGRFIYISGSRSATDYESAILEGGNTYYLHLGYYKNSSTDTGDDQIKINSIKIYKVNETIYNFVENNGKYESTNQGKGSTLCNSYIPINLENYQGKYNLTINAEALSDSSSDHGYVTITNNTDRPYYSNATGRLIYTSGSQSAEDYETVLEGGRTYYLHMGYYNDSTSAEDDKFIINSINLSLNDSDLYHTRVETNSEGQAITQVPFGKYVVTEIEAPEGYVLNDIPNVIEFREGGSREFSIQNDKLCNVTVHHYYKDNGVPTTIKVADDEQMQGKEGETYNTLPKVDLLNYELEKDENDEYIIPLNHTGDFTYEDKEVIYYYTAKGTLLTVHHYIDKTDTEVPLKDGTLAETEYIIGNKGTRYETNSLTEDELSDYYVYSHVDGDTTGIYGDNEIIVNYYYKKAQSHLIINKYGEDGVTPLEGAKFSVTDVDDNVVQLGEMTNNGTYFFEKQGDKYVSNNQNKIGTVANSYIKIDMTYAKKDAKVIVNAEMSGQRYYDYGHIFLAESADIPSMNDTSEILFYTSGIVNATDYEANLEKGKVYYLHFGYAKHGNTCAETDCLTINSISIEGAKTSQIFTTNSQGKIEEELDVGEYEIREIKAPYGYISGAVQRTSITKQNDAIISFTNERKIGRVIVHHYVEGTEIPAAEDDIIEKKVFEQYNTSVSESALNKYTLVEEPINDTGIIKEEDTIVTYYYRRNTGNLKINKVDVDTNESLEGVRFGIYEGDYGKVTLDDAIKVGDVYDKIVADKTDESNILPELSVPSGGTGFSEIGGKYIPVNCQWYVENQDNSYEGNSWADAYIDIDLSEKDEADYFVLTSNVEMRNTTINDCLWIWFTEGYSNGDWISLSGEKNEDYEICLNGGRNYRLQIEYNKSSGSDVEDYVAVEMKLFNAENVRVDTINEVPYYYKREVTTEEISIEKEHYTETSIGLPFVENDGKYIATTCQKYMNDNSVDPATNTTNCSAEYIIIDLSDKEGYYAVSIDLLMQNTTYDDWFYSWVENVDNTDEWAFLETEDGIRAEYLTSEHNERYQIIAEGGKKYNLCLEYGKNSNTDIEDYVEVSNVKVYKVNMEKAYVGFDKTSDGKYVSNNQGEQRSRAHSVVPIDLRDKENTIELNVNAEISSENNYDKGMVIISDSFKLIDVLEVGYDGYELICISGEVAAQDYTVKLEGGKLYYMHMLYEKDSSVDGGEDTFTINSINAETPLYDTITTDSEGMAEITLPTNDYTLIELVPLDGYEFIEPQKVTLTQDGLDLTIENERIKGKVTTNHFIEGTEDNISDYDGEEIMPELKKGLYGVPFETNPRVDLNEKYELVESPDEPNGEFSENPQIKTYYYRIKKYPYVVNYLLKDDDDDDTNNIVLKSQKASVETYDYGTIINAEDEKTQIEGYVLDSVNMDNLKITGSNNVINIYYSVAPKDLVYNVEFYKDNVLQDDDEIEKHKTVLYTDDDEFEVDVASINIEDLYTGYKLDHLSIFDGENEMEITEIPTSIHTGYTIRVHYVKDTFAYKVEYYYDDVLDEDATEEDEAEYGDVITDYTDKVKDGYRLKEEVLPIQITEEPTQNVMHVYYVTDDSKTKELTYKVEYYKDGEEVIGDAHNKTITVQVLQPNTIIVEKSNINIVDKYEHYSLDKIMIKSGDSIDEVTTLPDTVNDNDIIKIYYKQIKYPYRIEYYFDNVMDEELTENGEAGYGEKIKNYTDNNRRGYKLKEEVLPIQITEELTQNVMKVYYVTDATQTKELIYKVEYYKDDEKVESDTLTKKVIVQVLQPDTITVDKTEINYTDKYEHSTYEKMMLNNETITSVPDTVQSGDTIKVYYKVKDSQIIVKFVDEDGNTIRDNTIINGKVDETFDLDRVNDVVDGYELKSKSEEGVVTFEETSKEIIYVYRKVKTPEKPQEKPKENTNTTNTINTATTTITNIVETKQNEPVQTTVATQNPTSEVKQTQQPTSTAKEQTNKDTTTKESLQKQTPALGDKHDSIAYIAIMVIMINTIIVVVERSKKK